MIETMLTINWWVATGILILEIAVILKILSYLFLIYSKKETSKKFKHFLNNYIDTSLKNISFHGTRERYMLIVIFLSSLFASIMTLVYSEIFLQIPCALCWFERIFMYGTVVLSGLSLFEPHPTHYHFQLKNILIFSILGAGVSLYHHILQMTASASSHLPCPTSGGDCAKRIMFEYGHITFPWAATVLFTFFICIILIQNKLRLE